MDDLFFQGRELGEKPLDENDVEFGAYLVRHSPRDPKRLIIVFNGSGLGAQNGRIEEFGATLLPSGVSVCFVQDRSPLWLAHDESPQVLDHLAALARGYDHVGALGVSMGASSAVGFAAHCPKVERVLAFAPQFSMSDPFIRFDDRFRIFNLGYGDQLHRIFDAPDRQARIVILYGTEDWRDLVHAGLYAVYGYDVGFVDGSDHQVAAFLKRSLRGNLLAPLGARFADFSAPFDYDAVADLVGDLLSRRVWSRDRGVGSDLQWRVLSEAAATSPQRPPSPEGMTDLARGRTTDQSSISRWSHGTAAEDSARAVSGVLTGGYSFHTGKEDRPWWSIDFGEDVVVRVVRIFNRLGEVKFSDRCIEFAIEVADEGSDWREVFRKIDRKPFGGADGRPFVWTPEAGLPARRLRIRLLDLGSLCYDQIEIFG